MVTSTRKIYYRDEDFSLEYELSEGGLLLHCNVNRFTPSVVRNGVSVFAFMLDEAQAAGVEKVYTVTPNPKFAKMFGGTKVNEFSYFGKEYEVIEWDLKQQQ